jgi:hypothetical protein
MAGARKRGLKNTFGLHRPRAEVIQLLDQFETGGGRIDGQTSVGSMLGQQFDMGRVERPIPQTGEFGYHRT